MGGRYLVSGTQIGLVLGMLANKRVEEASDLIDAIEKEQFIGTSDKHINDDLKYLQSLLVKPK